MNISRETLQQDKNIQLIRKSVENKIKNELTKMLNNDRENYKKFFKNFGMQIKFGVYNNYGIDKDKLKDLILFYSANKKDYITLKEYIDSMKEEQMNIYYASGETIDKIDLLPQVEQVKQKDYDIIYLTDYVDEFVIQVLGEYENKKFMNVSSNDLNLETEEEKKSTEEKNNQYKDVFEYMKKTINNDVTEVRFTNRLKNHPVCLTTKGDISLEMEKVINSMPNSEEIKANQVLEINENHEISNKLKSLYENDKEKLEQYTKILYAQARLIEGLTIENPTEISNLICELISK